MAFLVILPCGFRLSCSLDHQVNRYRNGLLLVARLATIIGFDIFALGHVIKKTASDENLFFANGTNHRVPLY